MTQPNQHVSVGRWSNQPVPDPRSAAPVQTGPGYAPPSRGEVLRAYGTQPILVAVAVALLTLLAVFGLALRWGQLQMPYPGDINMEISTSGFGVLSFQMDVAGVSDSALDATFLTVAIIILFFVLAGAALMALTSLKRVGSVVTTVGGVGLIAYAIYGLVTGLGVTGESDATKAEGLGADGEELLRQLMDAAESSVGPGQYVVLVIGVLIVALGGFFAISSDAAWLPDKDQGSDPDAALGRGERP